MKLIKKNILKELSYLVLRRIYIRLFWKFPSILPSIKQPYVIEIELTNHCNMSCIHCHRSIMDRKQGYMQMYVFRKFIDEIATFPLAFLRIVGQGESALHPQFHEMMHYAAGKSIKIELVTNGSVFNRYSFEEILKWDIDIMGISIDGVDKEDYMRIRKGGDYDQLENNIKNFYLYRNSRKCMYPLICVRNVIFPENTHQQIIDYKSRWLNSADVITFNTLQTYENSGSQGISECERCREFFFEAHIRYDGSVLLCQHQFVYGENEIIGNLKDSSLKEIWRSERLIEMRRLHRTKDFPLTCRLCRENIKRLSAYSNSRKYNDSGNKFLNLLNRIVNVT
jgi:radical SAM protein with 4Fe4S-binding SPASM domain